MATPNELPRKPPSQVVEEIDKLYGTIEAGHAAESVKTALNPLIERRLALLLDKLSNCPPELGPLLDLRAKIAETWRMRILLSDQAKTGKQAIDLLKSVFENVG